MKDRHENASRKKIVAWFGTSVSKPLAKQKFEEDTSTKLKVVKAYCIKPEGKFPNSNFSDVVPNELKEDTPDVAVFQTGSIDHKS